MANVVTCCVVVSARERDETSLSEWIGRLNLTIPSGGEYMVEATGPEEIAQTLGARFGKSKIVLILEFGKNSGNNKRLCKLLQAIKTNAGADELMIPNIDSAILCYEHGLPKELEECQRFFNDNKVTYNILWAHSLPREFGKRFSSPFSVINLQLNIEDIPKAAFLRERALYIPEDLAPATDRDKVIEERFWYWDEKAAAAYNHLKGSEPYDVFFKNLNVLESNSSDMIERTFKEIRSTSKTDFPSLDFVALGVGSAEKELNILEQILNYYRRNKVTRKINYVPVDISFPLLQYSIRSLLSDKDFSHALTYDILNIQPILTDILRLRGDHIGGHENKLVAALGLLWNVPIHKAFEAFNRIMNDNSLLLVDVEFVGLRSKEEILASYDNDLSKEFFFHPLELLNLASQTNERFLALSAHGYRYGKLYRESFKNYSLESGDVSVDVIEGSNATAFIKEHGLPNSANKHLNFGPLKNSKTVIIFFVPHDDKTPPIVLGYSTRFEYAEFLNYIRNETDFTIKMEVYDNAEDKNQANVGYFLLKNSSDSIG